MNLTLNYPSGRFSVVQIDAPGKFRDSFWQARAPGSSLVFFLFARSPASGLDRGWSGEEGRSSLLPNPGQNHRPEGSRTRHGKTIGGVLG